MKRVHLSGELEIMRMTEPIGWFFEANQKQNCHFGGPLACSGNHMYPKFMFVNAADC